MLGLIQLLMIGSFTLLLASPVALVVLTGRYLFKRTSGRSVLIASSFVLGALVTGVAVWHAMPSAWTLPFWKTLEASVNAEKYGHPIEHYAQGVVMALVFSAPLGGAAAAGAAVIGARLTRRELHHPPRQAA